MVVAQQRAQEKRTKPFIISADCHVSEPPDLWETRIDQKFRHRLPHQEVRDGEKWLVVEGQRPVRVREFKLEGEDLERQNAGSRVPEERVKDHARDGIDAEVIYPNRGLMMFASPDAEMQLAMCRVWNDWTNEVFGAYGDRMQPVAAIPPDNVDDAIAESRRVAKMGFRTVFLPVKAHEKPYNHRQFEPLWAELEELGLPISFHVGTGRDPRTAWGLGGAVINYAVHALGAAQEPIAQFCASGIPERYPRLRFGTVEAGIGWVPWLLHVLDEAYKKHHFWVYPKLEMLPSDYFRRQGFATFQDDPIGVQFRDIIGVDNMLWGNDYPHHEGTWPHSAEIIESQLGDWPEADRRKVLGENAAKLYGFEIPAG